MKNVVIIGTGMAGYSVARELRKLDPSAQLIMISEDDAHFYSKPMLSNAIAQSKTSSTLITTPMEKIADQINAQILPHTRVLGIDISGQNLELEKQGRKWLQTYDQLVLAMGASQRQPHFGGDAASEAISINSLADYARFEERLKSAKHISIVGSGLIGCEFANDLLSGGYEVVVVGASSTPLSHLLPQPAGEFFASKLQDHGVQWKHHTKVEGINKIDQRFELSLSDGDKIRTDLVLTAIGLQPNIILANTAGIHTNKGIVADSELRTSVNNVFALGDCTEISGQVLAYILPIMHSARALAKTLSGEATSVKFPVMPVIVKTPAHPVVAVPPPRGTHGDWQVERQPNGVSALFYDQQDVFRGYALTGSEVARKQQLNQELSKLIGG